jgi:hypothetical protein
MSGLTVIASRTILTTTAVVALVTLPVAACSSSVKLSSAKMCTAAGGTYSAGACNSGTPNQKSAKQICDAHGGVYDPVLDMCEISGDK